MSSGTRQVVVIRSAKKTESVRQHLENALGKDEPALLGLRLEDLKNQLLLAHAGGAGDGKVLRNLRELLNALVLQLRDVEALTPATFSTSLMGWSALAFGSGLPFLSRLTLRALLPLRTRLRLTWLAFRTGLRVGPRFLFRSRAAGCRRNFRFRVFGLGSGWCRFERVRALVDVSGGLARGGALVGCWHETGGVLLVDRSRSVTSGCCLTDG